MQKCWTFLGVFIITLLMVLVSSKSYYSIIAPGVIKSNRKYTVAASLHEADEPALMRISIDGPLYHISQEVFLRPYETKKLHFEAFQLERGSYNLTAEGISGIQFHQQNEIIVEPNAGPKIYIQPDKAIYKPGDLAQFRVVMLDEHTKPLKIRDPIHIEILDGNGNRIKQFKNINPVKGVYTGSFSISKFPAMGLWQIKVILTGNYDCTRSKHIQIQKYVLPKFSVYIKTDSDFVPQERTIKATVYGKYTFDKYVEGNVTATIVNPHEQIELQQKRLTIDAMADLEFTFDNPKDLEDLWAVTLRVDLKEKYTGITHQDSKLIRIRDHRYCITVDSNSIEFSDNKPYRLKAKVTYWNQTQVRDGIIPFVMLHGSKEYRAYLDGNGEAIFEFEYEPDADHIFRFLDSEYKYFNIFSDNQVSTVNDTQSYCKMRLKGVKPRLGSKLEIEISSEANIPYLVYIIVCHGGIVRLEHIKVPDNQNTYTLEITPTIEMIPNSVIYVHYIQNGELHYDEMKLEFPMEFENQISMTAPPEAVPGQEVTLNVKAQRKSYVSVLAVDLGVYLLDSSYDLQRNFILNDLVEDQTYLPFGSLIYPGCLAGVLTFTNAMYPSGPMIRTTTTKYVVPKQLKLRKKFPETWIFRNYEISDDNTQITLNIPHTITTWRVTAFSVHEVTGFGMLKEPSDILAIKPFFISLNLPYSVKRGEIVSISLLLFNYHNQSLDCEVIMYNKDMEFYFVESTLAYDEQGSDDTQRVQHVHVAANGIKNMVFWITPKQVGELSLRITAENLLSSDAVFQKLKVEPEGMPKRDFEAMYISAPAGETFSLSMTASIPLDIVPDSEYISLSVGGDSLVPVLANINDLVHLPTDCGEQNMVHFAPNILVLDYLKTSHRYGRERKLVSRAKNFIEIGYQQQLSYRHKNGGYSVFGPTKDKEPGTWMTAYVIRYFIKAEKYLSIDGDIIKSGLEYLSGKQTQDGDFEFTGYVIQPAVQNRFGFTAFVLMTFLEQEKYAMNYQTTVQKALAFLKNNLSQVQDIYALAIMAAALQMANDASALVILNKLEENQRLKPGLKWWSENDMNHEKDVEITAYVLMVLLDRDNDAKDDLRILRWLMEQRNDLSGFKSTHDTVVALEALVKFSQKYNDLKNHNLKIQYSAKNNETNILQRDELRVDANNALLLQMEELPKATRFIDFEITGTGYTLLQLSYRYHVKGDNNFRHFDVKPEAKMLNPDEMLLKICFSYHQPGVPENNMILMEVNLPSGFTSRDEDNNNLLQNEIIQKIEAKNSATTLVINFKNLSTSVRHCFNILGDRIHDVMMRKPAAVVVYDYYNINRYDTAFYSV